MNRQTILSVLIVTVLCSCSTERKTPNPPSSARPSEVSAPGQSTRELSSNSDGEKSGLGDYIAFPASGIELRQPEGFEKADSFDGFGQPETQSSVMAVRILAPYSKATAGFTREQMKTRGLALLSREDVKIGDLPGILAHFEQPAGGSQFLKWCVAFGDDQKTTMVTATFPKGLERELSARLKSAVLSTRPGRVSTSDPDADLPFTLAGSQKLKLTPGVISKAVFYTKDGAIPAKSPKDPLFIVAPSLGNVVIRNERQSAERRLREIAELKRVSITSTDPIAIDGLDGYESLAEAEDVQSGTPLFVYQVMLFDKGSYILMHGVVGAELHDEYLPEFRTMARSFRRKRP